LFFLPVYIGESAIRGAMGALEGVFVYMPKEEADGAAAVINGAATQSELRSGLSEGVRIRVERGLQSSVFLIGKREPLPPETKTVLQIKILSMSLRPGSRFQSQLKFNVVAYAKLKCLESGDDFRFCTAEYASGERHTLGVWAANDAFLFREELLSCRESLADQIVQKLFGWEPSH
jgi:hypothetical protein